MADLLGSARPRLRPDLRVGRRAAGPGGRLGIVVQDPVLRGLGHPGFRLSAPAELLLPLLDGSKSLPELTAAMTAAGSGVDAAAIAGFVHRLNELQLLELPATRRTIEDIERRCAAALVRPPCNSMGPPASPAAVGACFERVARAAENGRPSRPGRRPGLLVLPHAAVEVSGTCAARAVSRLAAHRLASLYLIVGPNHVAPGPARAEIILQPFQTPLGRVEVDLVTSQRLAGSGVGVEMVHLNHFRDHSIENVLVFLQWLHADRANRGDANRGDTDTRPFRIVPLLLTGARHRPGLPEPADHLALWHRLGRALREIRDECPGERVLVASGDFSHIGPNFGFTPPGVEHPRDAERWELQLRQSILAGDGDSFLHHWVPTNACAGRPLLTMLAAAGGGWRWSLIDNMVTKPGANMLSVASYAAYDHA